MKKKGFTLIELIAVLLILAMLVLIVTPLVLSIIRKAKISADRRSVDAYGRSIEIAIANYMLDTGKSPINLDLLNIEYKGSEVVCEIKQQKYDGGIYLSKCKIKGKYVKDSSTEDGYYHYNDRDPYDYEYVDMYGKSLEEAIGLYYEENNEYPSDYKVLKTNYKGKDISCDVTINVDGSVFLTACKVLEQYVAADTYDGYYHYGYLYAIDELIRKSNPTDISTYEDGNTHQMYYFSHNATAKKPALDDYRYIGDNPNNYITFNNEMWRIIGIFKVEEEDGVFEYRIKLMKDTPLEEEIPWNSGSNANNGWTTSTLYNYLEEDYYNSLSASSKSMIKSIKTYLNSAWLPIEMSADKFYRNESGDTTYSSLYKTSIYQKIGLIYPSDYLYTFGYGIDDICFNDGYKCKSETNGVPQSSWMYDGKQVATITLTHANGYCIFNIANGGYVTYTTVSDNYSIKPVVYLSEKVKIKSGNGTIDNPYKIEMKSV